MYEYECEAMWSRQQPGSVADISIRDDPIRPPFRWKHHLPAWLPRLDPEILNAPDGPCTDYNFVRGILRAWLVPWQESGRLRNENSKTR